VHLIRAHAVEALFQSFEDYNDVTLRGMIGSGLGWMGCGRMRCLLFWVIPNIVLAGTQRTTSLHVAIQHHQADITLVRDLLATYVDIHRIFVSCELVFRGKLLVNARDYKNDTVLHVAVRRGVAHLVEFLVKYGANPESRNNVCLFLFF